MRYIGFFLLISLLNACSFGVPVGTVYQPSSPQKNTSKSTNKAKSYIVFGKQYTLLNSSDGYVKRGIASWYGKKFHGRKTSNGEVYDMFAMTAAHKSLPLPTRVSVKNLSNGKTIIVRVNDRGPFIDDRLIDLSYAAAKKLDIIKNGTARVEIRAISDNNTASVVRTIPLKDSSEDSVNIYIQVGSFSLQDNASSLVKQLNPNFNNAADIYPVKTNNGIFYRVRVGPYDDIEKAKGNLKKIRDKQHKQARLVIEN